MVGRVTIARQSAQAKASTGNGFNIRQRHAIDVDQERRSLHAVFHQVDQIGAASQKLCVFAAYDRVNRSLLLLCPLIFK
jgi:hypothetical protein